MSFLLQSEFITKYNNVIERNCYEILFSIDLLNQENQDKIVYDKELKIYLEFPGSPNRIYEIEISHINLNLSDRLKKAEDYTRRLFYRYDWIQAKIDGNNKLINIVNTDEILNTWDELKLSIFEDYKGVVVENDIDDIDKRMKTQNFMLSPMFQYFYLGLIFLGIPPVHDIDWKNQRKIEFSDYEEEQFLETISYNKTFNDLRLYNITGNVYPGSTTQINEYTGLIRIKDKDTFPKQVDLSVYYIKDKTDCFWKFKLEHYDEIDEDSENDDINDE